MGIMFSSMLATCCSWSWPFRPREEEVNFESYLYCSRESVEKRIKELQDVIKIRRKGDGMTLLMVGSVVGDVDLVDSLLTLGASTTEQDNGEGNTALIGACLAGHLGVVKALVGAGAPLSQANDDGITPWIAAAWRGHLPILKFLQTHSEGKQRGAFVEMKQHVDKHGRTARDLANEWGHANVVAWLDGLQ